MTGLPNVIVRHVTIRPAPLPTAVSDKFATESMKVAATPAAVKVPKAPVLILMFWLIHHQPVAAKLAMSAVTAMTATPVVRPEK